jgi:hypothetical protein
MILHISMILFTFLIKIENLDHFHDIMEELMLSYHVLTYLYKSTWIIENKKKTISIFIYINTHKKTYFWIEYRILFYDF